MVFVRKSLKNCGQEGSVKLLPDKLASKGRGSDVDMAVAVSIVSDTDEVEDGGGMSPDPVDTVDELVESSCRA